MSPKSLSWVSPFPLCWCSFLERRPVCVTAASAESVQSRAGPLGSWEGARLQGEWMLPLPACLSDRSSSENHFGCVYFSTFTISWWDVIMVGSWASSLCLTSYWRAEGLLESVQENEQRKPSKLLYLIFHSGFSSLTRKDTCNILHLLNQERKFIIIWPLYSD